VAPISSRQDITKRKIDSNLALKVNSTKVYTHFPEPHFPEQHSISFLQASEPLTKHLQNKFGLVPQSPVQPQIPVQHSELPEPIALVQAVAGAPHGAVGAEVVAEVGAEVVTEVGAEVVTALTAHL
jgi:hypothetical protein